ncbi:MAG: hypothetical protein MRJ93_10170 [Nitrososphaeraceae archaeon]|nr:hypothetical protein [Nitrososphaeraceae archaeon]
MKINLTSIWLLSTLSILNVATSLTATVYAQEEGNVTDSEEPMKFFAIQHAQSGSISETNSTAYSLELNDVSDKTILFSDRPERIVTSISTADFIGNWTNGPNSFALDAPNAVLVVDEQGIQDNAIVDLFNPIYDLDKKTLKYEVTPDNATSINISTKFGQVTSFIDTGSNQGVVAEMIALGGNR